MAVGTFREDQLTMRDNQIYILLTQLLTVQAPPRGIVAEYAQRYQPTQQGRNTDRTVMFFKVLDKAIGSAQVSTVPNGATMQRTETQSMEATIQFSVTQPPAMADGDLTHNDVLKAIRATLQSQDAQKFLVANGASVLRVGDMRNPFMVNDRGQFEPNPSFDLILKHNDVFVDGVPFIETFNFQYFPVPAIA